MTQLTDAQIQYEIGFHVHSTERTDDGDYKLTVTTDESQDIDRILATSPVLYRTTSWKDEGNGVVSCYLEPTGVTHEDLV